MRELVLASGLLDEALVDDALDVLALTTNAPTDRGAASG